MTFARPLLLSLLVSSLSVACGDPEPQSEPPPEPGSAGEIVYHYFCERSVAQEYGDESPKWAAGVCVGDQPPDSAPADLLELHAHRDEIIAAYESWIPPQDDEQLQALIVANPWEEVLATPAANIANALEQVANDDDSVLATTRLRVRDGYRPFGTSNDPLHVLVTYPGFAALSAAALSQVTSAEAEVLALEWATATYSPVEPGFADRFHQDLKRRPVVVLARDNRGLARPNPESAVGFVDADADGLYDVDEYDRWVAADGTVLGAPTPFATSADEGARGGVAVDSRGTPVYETNDLDGTAGVALVRLVAEWAAADSSIFTQWVGAFRALLGPQVEGTATYGSAIHSHQTLEVSRSPLVDAVYAASTALSLGEMGFVLELVMEWIEREDPAFASLVEVTGRFASSTTELPAGSTAPADTLDLMSRIAQTPGMLEAIADFLETDEGVRLTTAAGAMMRNKARVTWSPGDPMGPPVGLDEEVAVDRSMPGALDNRSQFERLLALLDGMRGVRVCSRAGEKFQVPSTGTEWPLIGGTDECQLLEIPDLGEAFLRSFAADFEVTLDPSFGDLLDFVGTFQSPDPLLEEIVGIDGFTRRPSPQALSRFIFWALADESGVASCDPAAGNCNGTLAAGLVDPVSDRHGNPLIERHHGTSFILEDPEVFAAVRSWMLLLTSAPVMGAGGFDELPVPAADPQGRCGEACWAAGELVAVAHTNWSTPDDPITQSDDPAMPHYAEQGGLRNYEEDLAELLVDDEFPQKWRTFMSAARQESRDELDGRAAILSSLEAALDPARTELTNRQGATSVTLADGARELPVTPAALFVHAEEAAQTAFAETPNGTSVDALQTDVFDRLFAMDATEDRPVWRDREARAILILGLKTIADERALAVAGDELDSWPGQVADDLGAWLSSPAVATVVLFVDRMIANATSEVAAFVEYVAANYLDMLVFEYADHRESLADETRRIALAQAWSEAVVPGVGAYVAGENTELDTGSGGFLSAARMLDQLLSSDSGAFAAELLARLLEPEASPTSPLDHFASIVDAVLRAFVGEEATVFDATRSLLQGVGDVISSDSLGVDVLLERLVASVDEST